MATENPPQTPIHYRSLLSILVLSSALSTVLTIFRIWYSGNIIYVFLNWNLLLAWIPVGLAFLLWRLDSRLRPLRSLMLLVFAGWLLFFPNSPYIVSDLMHLAQRDTVPLWYDMLMIFTFAWNGLILGFLSLWLVQQLVAYRFGATVSWLMVAFTLWATGFGIYLGRFQRWNSWDILVDPVGLLRDVAIRVANPFDYPRTIGVTVLFAGFLTVAYLTLILLPAALHAERSKS